MLLYLSRIGSIRAYKRLFRLLFLWRHSCSPQGLFDVFPAFAIVKGSSQKLQRKERFVPDQELT